MFFLNKIIFSWDLMKHCWSRSPKSRPNFIEVIEMLINDTNEQFLKISYYSKHKSQQKHKSLSQLITDDPSVPLKQISNSLDIEESLMDACDDTGVHYFPSAIAVPENSTQVTPTPEDENYDIDHQIDELSHSEHLLRDVSIDNQNNTNHNNSKQSSDGSKGSKISSTTSNGSIANGHAVHYKTTMC